MGVVSMSAKKADEQRVDLEFWMKNGFLFPHNGQGRSLPTVSIGRTDSERGLGFLLEEAKTRKTLAAFVLDRSQVENLHAYLGGQIGRLKKMRWPSNALSLPALAERARRQRAAALGRRRARQRSRRREGGST